LEPVEGMQAWAVSNSPKPRAPGYVKMPGRPKKNRKREAGEKPKTTRVSKVGTRIRCSKCKGVGHNISSCDRRHGVASGPAAFTGSQSSAARNAAPSAADPIQLLLQAQMLWSVVIWLLLPLLSVTFHH